MIWNSTRFLQRSPLLSRSQSSAPGGTGYCLRFGPKGLAPHFPLPWRQPLQTTLQPLLAALAEAVHVVEVLGEIILPLLLQVLLVALEQLGSAGL